MTPAPIKTPVKFYKHASGREPVLDWLRKLGPPRSLEIGQDLTQAQFRWPVGMPLVRPLGQGLHEVRTTASDGTIGRVFLCFWDGKLWALHGIIKKTEQTPKRDLDLARDRQKDVESGEQ